MTIIIEDKHDFNATLSNDWGEYQMVGEIIVFAYYSANTKKTIKPLTINAIRIVDTTFTFYKTEILPEYIYEGLNSRPKDNLIIKRYPPREDFRNIGALDFCNSEERVKILNYPQRSLSSSGSA